MVMTMLLTEKMLRADLSESEKVAINYVIQQKEMIKNKTLKQIARETYTNPSTLIRVAKKLGYSGWNELKEQYLQEIDYLNRSFNDIDANKPFDENDNLMAIANKMAQLNQTTINDTLALIRYADLNRAVQILLNASEIKIFAHNQNILISQDFAYKMNRIQKPVTVCALDAEQVFEAFNCRKGSCALFISYSGESKRFLKILPVLKQNKIPILSLTSLGENTLTKKSDCVLRISTRERLYSNIADFTKNNSICYLLDVLYSCVFSKNYQKNLAHKIAVSQYADSRQSSVDLINEAK